MSPQAHGPVHRPGRPRVAGHGIAPGNSMNARLDFLLGYIGSAALVAFLATCLDAPRVATYTCDTPPGQTREKCELSETLPATPVATSDSNGASRVWLALDAAR